MAKCIKLHFKYVLLRICPQLRKTYLYKAYTWTFLSVLLTKAKTRKNSASLCTEEWMKQCHVACIISTVLSGSEQEWGQRLLQQDKHGNMLNLWKAVTAAHLLCDSSLGTFCSGKSIGKGNKLVVVIVKAWGLGARAALENGRCGVFLQVL